jgi:hypothetical protein
VGGCLPAAIIAWPIVGSAIPIVIRPDDAGTIHGTGLFIVANHPPFPINRSGVIAVIIAVAVRSDWCSIAIRCITIWRGSCIGLRRSAGNDGSGSQTDDTSRDCSPGSSPGTSLGVRCREAPKSHDAGCGKNSDLTHEKSPE